MRTTNNGPLPLNIIDFLQHPDLLNDRSLSATQITCLKAIYGLPLTDSELAIYRHGTGRENYDATEQTRTTLIAGRCGGKTGKIAAPTVIFEAFRSHGLPDGEEGYVMLLAPTIDQATIALKYILAYLRKSKILKKRIVRTTNTEIELDNNVTIGCYACTHDGLRGRTIIAAVCDEIGLWPDGPNVANSAEEVIAALTPGMATVRNAKLIKISTPYVKSGVLWEELRHRSELDFPVWQLTSFEMNPKLSPEKFVAERRESEARYRREYLAQFTDALSDWVTPDILDPCIVPGRHNLPRQLGVNYFAALDPAMRGDDFALVIVHQAEDSTIVVDCVASWTGSAKAPLLLKSVLLQITNILQSYSIHAAVGDQYCSDVIAQQLMELGVSYTIRTFGSHTRADIFLNLLHLVIQGRIQLPDDPGLLQQIRSLRAEQMAGGHVDVRPPAGLPDDKVVALALVVREAVLHPAAPLSTIDLGLVAISPSLLSRLVPDGCPVAAVCGNFPMCFDESSCLGFKDERVTWVRI